MADVQPLAAAAAPSVTVDTSNSSSGSITMLRESMRSAGVAAAVAASAAAAVAASPSSPPSRRLSPSRRPASHSRQQQQQHPHRSRSPLRSAGLRPPSGGGASGSGALWALATGVPEQSAGTRRALAAQAAQVAQAQPAVAAAADALLRSCMDAVQFAQEQKESSSGAAAAAALAAQGGSSLPARARRAATARLERKLLRDLDVRHATPLRDLPSHVNTDTHLQAQALPGQVSRLRNIVETQANAFKNVHAHVHANWNHTAHERLRQMTEEETIAAEIEAQRADTEAVRSYAANQVRARRAAEARASPRNVLIPSATRTLSASASVPALASSASASGAAAAAGPGGTAALPASPEPASTRSYNKYASLRPSVVAEYKLFQREVAALPPRLNPAPLRHSSSAGSRVGVAGAQAARRASSASGRTAHPVLAESASQPALQSPAAAAAAAHGSIPPEIDFAYTPDSRALHAALQGLPLPLAAVKPAMFAFEYAPPISVHARNKILTPRGSHLTVEARGYSSAERVSLLVDGFRQEHAQVRQNSEWISGFKRRYLEENTQRKTDQAKQIWAHAVAAEEQQQQQQQMQGEGGAEQQQQSDGKDDALALSDPFREEAERAQKRQPANAHLLSLPPTSSSSSSSLSPSMAGRGSAHSHSHSHSASQPSLHAVQEIPRSISSAASPSSWHRRSPTRPAPINTRAKSPMGSGGVAGTAGAAGAAAPGGARDDTPSPTTPEGFWFTSKLALASYNKRKLEKELGLGPSGGTSGAGANGAGAGATTTGAAAAGQHAYDSDDDEWLHGGVSDNSGAEESGEEEGGSTTASARAREQSDGAAAAAATAAAAAKQHEAHMSRMLREVFANAKKAATARFGSDMASVLPLRKPGKTLNAARFVMENPARRKARLAKGEAYARGNGFITTGPGASAAGVQVATQAAAAGAVVGDGAAAADPDEDAVAVPNDPHGGSPGAGGGTAGGAARPRDPDAPMVYSGVEPNWLRVRPDYSNEFLPRSRAFLALNSMEKPLAIRSAQEVANIASYLRTLPYLRDFSAQARLQSELVALARLQPAAKKGDVLYRAGEVSTCFYILVSGSVRAITRPPPPQGLFSETEEALAAEFGPLRAATASAAGRGARPNLPRLDTSMSQTAGSNGASVDLGGGGGGGIRMLGPHVRAPSASTEHNDALDMSSQDGNGTFLSKRAQQMSPAKRAWSAARERAARAQALAADDYGLSDPNSTVVLLSPGAVFGQSREAVVAREAEEAVKRALEQGMAPARLRWRRLAEGVRLNKRLMSRYHKAAQEVEGIGSSSSSHSGRPARHGSASVPRPANSPSAKAAAAHAHYHANPAIAAARLRAETVICASDDTLLIAISQADHDRVIQSSIDRHHFAQVVALKAMTLFQQPQHQAQQQQAQQQQQQQLAHQPKNSKSSSKTKDGTVSPPAGSSLVASSVPGSAGSSRAGPSLSAWRIKHLVQLVPHLQPQRYEAGGVVAEEDSLCHHLWLLVSGSVSVWKDVELIAHTRLPAGPTDPVTVVETKKFKRVQVATRTRGDALAEECVAGAPKLDFTYKAGPNGAELYAIHRAHFLPFFRAPRLAQLKARVSAARSAAVNYLNGVVADMLPGNAREQLGLSGMGGAASATSGGSGGADEARTHLLHVNMLEALAEDLRGEEEELAARGPRSPNGHQRRRHMRFPTSPSHAQQQQNQQSQQNQQQSAQPSESHAHGSHTLRTPARVDGGAGKDASASLLSPLVHSPSVALSASSSPAAALLAAASSLMQPGLVEHRPRTPAKYASATRLACRIVTNPRPDRGAAAASASDATGADEVAAAEAATVASIFASSLTLPASAAPSPTSSSSSSRMPADAQGKVARKITFQDEDTTLGAATAPTPTSAAASASGSLASGVTRLARASSMRQLTAGNLAALTGPMLSSAGIQVAEADVRRIQMQQQAAAEAARAAAEARAAAAAETAAATKAASPQKKTRTISSANLSIVTSTPAAATPSPSAAASSSLAASASPAPHAHVHPSNSASAGVKLGSTTTVTSRVLSRGQAGADEAATAPQVHVYFSLFTI